MGDFFCSNLLAMNQDFQSFKKRITNGSNFRLFLFKNLLSAYMAGIRLEQINEQSAVVTLKESWFNRNPFRSVYFAILAMAAEISTGVLCMGYLYKQSPCSMLVVKQEGSFFKKAKGKIRFTCNDGEDIHAAIQKAIYTGEGVTVHCKAIGTNSDNEVVAEFIFTWSFKTKNIQKSTTA